jgi:hypothetical protein
VALPRACRVFATKARRLRRFMYYKFIFSLVMLLFLGAYLRQGKHLFELVGGNKTSIRMGCNYMMRPKQAEA